MYHIHHLSHLALINLVRGTDRKAVAAADDDNDNNNKNKPLLASVEGLNTLDKGGVIGAEQCFLLDWL
jgi:hypothetical protein